MLKFSNYLQIINLYIGQDKSQNDFMTYFFSLIICEPYTEEDESKEAEEKYYPFAAKSEGSLARKVYKGERPLPVGIARFVHSHYEQDRLISRIENMGDTEKSNLCRDLLASGIECHVDSVAEVIADVLQRFIDAAIREEDTIEIATKATATIAIHDIEATNQEVLLLGEVENVCPLCGRQLMRHKGHNVLKQYKVVQIFPDNIPRKLFLDFNTIHSMNGRYDSDENRIALCMSCAMDYESVPSIDTYQKLLKIKSTAVQQDVLRRSLESIELEDEIGQIITELAEMTSETMLVPLNMRALRVEQKIHQEDRLLINSIIDDVVRYYKYIEDQFQDADSRVSNTFERVASEVKLAYEKLEGTELDQEQIYEELIAWIVRKLHYSERHRLAARIVISFFVQNCEVFHEISQ